MRAAAPELERSAENFYDGLRRGDYDGHLEASTAVRIASVLRYALGRAPLDLYELELKRVGTPATVIEDILEALTAGIDELTRPIDAIRHQAKTVTVGISRSEEAFLQSRLVVAALAAGTPRERLAYASLRTLAHLDPAVAEVQGHTRYRLDGLSASGSSAVGVLGSVPQGPDAVGVLGSVPQGPSAVGVLGSVPQGPDAVGVLGSVPQGSSAVGVLGSVPQGPDAVGVLGSSAGDSGVIGQAVQPTATVVSQGGVSVAIESRCADSPALIGTKHQVALERRVLAARGRRDGRTLVFVPEVSAGVTVGITLLHVRFSECLSAAVARGVLQGYRNRLSELHDAVTETEPGFDEALLGEITLWNCSPHR